MVYAIVGGIAAVIIALISALLMGKSWGSKSEQNKTLVKVDKVQDEQLKIANESNDVTTTLDSLHKHNF